MAAIQNKPSKSLYDHIIHCAENMCVNEKQSQQSQLLSEVCKFTRFDRQSFIKLAPKFVKVYSLKLPFWYLTL